MNKKINILPEKFFIRVNKSVQNLIYCLFLRCYHFWCYCRELREGPFQGGTRILGVYRVAGMCCSKDDPFCLWLWITFSLGKRGICHLSFDTWTGLFFFFFFFPNPWLFTIKNYWEASPRCFIADKTNWAPLFWSYASRPFPFCIFSSFSVWNRVPIFLEQVRSHRHSAVHRLN